MCVHLGGKKEFKVFIKFTKYQIAKKLRAAVLRLLSGWS